MEVIVIESGHERNRNAGDEAYYAAMVEMFQESLDDMYIISFSNRPERDRDRYGVETVYSGGSLIKTLASIFKIIRAIKRCDVYVWGAGQILRDDTGVKSPLYRLSRPWIAKIMGKKVMAYAPGIGPLESRKARFLAKKVLNKFDLITVRESYSRDLIKSIGVSKPEIHLTVDPAFGLNPAPFSQVIETLEKIGVKNDGTYLIGIAPFGPAFRGVKSVLPAKYQGKFDIWKPGGKELYKKHIKILAEVCDFMIKKYKSKLVFFIQDISWQGMDDIITEDIISLMKYKEDTVIIKSDDYPPALIKGIIGKLEFLMGGRMHSLILGSGIATPVLGIYYEQKLKNLGAIIDQKEYFIDVKHITCPEGLLTIIETLWSNRKKIKKELDEKITDLRKIADWNVKLLKDLLNR
jgi:polysaccharide pyruvyl transferase WcaK-like protein